MIELTNLVELYHTTNKEGMSWYVEANRFCRNLSDKYNLPMENVCAIVSILSPGVSWNRNKIEAEMLIKGKKSGYTTYKANVRKAKRALKEPQPDTLFNKRWRKTWNFYLALLNPENPETVVIDRHAYRTVTGMQYVGLTAKVYDQIADHFRQSAAKLGILPNQLQAVLWVWQRSNNSRPF